VKKESGICVWIIGSPSKLYGARGQSIPYILPYKLIIIVLSMFHLDMSRDHILSIHPDIDVNHLTCIICPKYQYNLFPNPDSPMKKEKNPNTKAEKSTRMKKIKRGTGELKIDS
jgi:hypothetical protein